MLGLPPDVTEIPRGVGRACGNTALYVASLAAHLVSSALTSMRGSAHDYGKAERQEGAKTHLLHLAREYG